MSIDTEYDPFLVGFIRHKLSKKKGKKRKFKHILRDQFMPLPMLLHKRKKERKRAKRRVQQAQQVRQLVRKPSPIRISKTIKQQNSIPKATATMKHSTTRLPNGDPAKKKHIILNTQNIAMMVGATLAISVLSVAITRAIVKK